MAAMRDKRGSVFECVLSFSVISNASLSHARVYASFVFSYLREWFTTTFSHRLLTLESFQTSLSADHKIRCLAERSQLFSLSHKAIVWFQKSYTFTFMHLADAFIQSDSWCIHAIHIFVSICVPWESNPQPLRCSNHWATGTLYIDTLMCPFIVQI